MDFVFVRQQGKVLGPFAIDRVRAAAAAGKFAPAAEYAAKREGPWQPVSTLRGPLIASRADGADDDDARFFGTLNAAAQRSVEAAAAARPVSPRTVLAVGGGVLAAGLLLISAIVIFGGGERPPEPPPPAAAGAGRSVGAAQPPASRKRPVAAPVATSGAQAATEGGTDRNGQATAVPPPPTAPPESATSPASEPAAAASPPLASVAAAEPAGQPAADPGQPVPPPVADPPPPPRPAFNPQNIDVRAARAMAETLKRGSLSQADAELVARMLALTGARDWQTQQGDTSRGEVITIRRNSVRLITKKGDTTIPRTALSEACQTVLDEITAAAAALHDLPQQGSPPAPRPAP
jgi:hypothetical protein